MRPSRFAPRSLRARLALAVGLVLAGFGLSLFLYLMSLPYWVAAPLSQHLALEPGPWPAGPSGLALPPADKPTLLLVVGTAWRARTRLWLYGLGGLELLTLLAVGATYGVIGRVLGSLTRLQRTVSRLPLDDLPAALPEFGPEAEVQALTAAYNAFLQKVHHLLQAQQQFVADAAHELRSPLAALRVQLAALQQPETLTRAERAQLLADAQAMVEHLAAVVEGLLLLLREPQPQTWAPIDLAALAQRVLAELAPWAQARQIALELQQGPAPAQVAGDRVLLRVVLRNLVENALRYNDPGGRVVVRIEATPAEVRLEVCDTGWGIPADELPRIFERFYRGRRAQQHPGTGLGLAVVERLVQIHGGRVRVESQPGRGTCVRVHLPRRMP